MKSTKGTMGIVTETATDEYPTGVFYWQSSTLSTNFYLLQQMNEQAFANSLGYQSWTTATYLFNNVSLSTSENKDGWRLVLVDRDNWIDF